MCGPSYDTKSDFSYPYKRHSVHSIQPLPSSAMDDSRELSSFYGRPASHISSSHYPMVSGHEGDSYSNAQYTPRGPELPQHSLYAPQSFYDYDLRQPHHQTGWGGVDPHTIASDSPLNYGTLGGSSFPEAPRLTPPPAPAITNNQRLTLAGSLDPTTGIFYRTPEHPRLRTAQACEKCRTRKAKVSHFCVHRAPVIDSKYRCSVAASIPRASAVSLEAWSASTPRRVGFVDPIGLNRSLAFRLCLTHAARR